MLNLNVTLSTANTSQFYNKQITLNVDYHLVLGPEGDGFLSAPGARSKERLLNSEAIIVYSSVQFKPANIYLITISTIIWHGYFRNQRSYNLGQIWQWFSNFYFMVLIILNPIEFSPFRLLCRGPMFLPSSYVSLLLASSHYRSNYELCHWRCCKDIEQRHNNLKKENSIRSKAGHKSLKNIIL